MTTKNDETKLQTMIMHITSVVANTLHVRKQVADSLNNISPPITELEGVVSLLTIAAVTCKDADINYDNFISLCSVIYDTFDQVGEFETDIGDTKTNVMN
jgi:hypothetical protein